MKIAYFMESFPQPSETFVLRHICGSIDAGHEVLLFPASEGTTRLVQPEVEAYALMARVVRPGDARGASRGVREQLERARAFSKLPVIARRRGHLNLRQVAKHVATLPPASFDVVHAHFGPSARRAALLMEAGWLSGSLISTFHGFDVNVLLRRHPASIYEVVFERSCALTVGTQFMQERLLWMGAPRERLHRMPMGVELEAFASRDAEPPVGDEGVRLLSVGRLSEGKGHRVVLDALASLSGSAPTWRLDVLGDGPLRFELERRCEALGLAERVTFHGGVTSTQVRETMRAAHVLVHAAEQAPNGWVEAQGLVLAEALASGVPVVSTRSGGIPDTIVDGSTGLLAEPSDVGSLRAALLTMLGDDALRRRLSAQGRLHVEARFDQRRSMEAFLSLYERVSGRPRAPR